MYFKLKDKNFKENKVEYNLKQNDEITTQIIIQKIVDLSSNLYHENIDCIDASFKLDEILDDLIKYN